MTLNLLVSKKMNSNSEKKIWITWEVQRRSVELAKKFECELYVFDCDAIKNRYFRILRCSFLTLMCLNKNNPNIVFCQNPSIFLAFLLCLGKKIFDFKLIVDRHSNFMFGRENSFCYTYFMMLSDYTIKKSDITILTNDGLKEKFIAPLDSRSVILPDALPQMISDFIEDWGDKKKRVFFITSFASDEPISEFFDAISGIYDDYYFYISGDYKKYNKNLEKYGSNYELTGFVTELEFKKILNSVDAVMVFTVHDFILTCGAYEGLSVEKPLILSNTNTIRAYFNKGCVYCDPTSESIKSGIFECFNNYDKFVHDVKVLKREVEMSWEAQFEKVNCIINNL